MEKIFQKVSFLSASLVFLVLVGIFVTLFYFAKPAMDEFGWRFISNPAWNKDVVISKDSTKSKANAKIQTRQEVVQANDFDDDDGMDMMPSDDNEVSQVKTKTIYGGLVPIVGTVLSTLIALLFSLPIAMGIAVFLSEIAPKNISNIVSIAIELLAAIPSIIFGMWGLYYFAPIVQKVFGGFQVSLLTAGLVLGVMILPFMAAITRDSMDTTPDVLKESAYALGATKFEVIKDVIFPYSKRGIIGSIVLALGRALGETMAVAFLIGSIFQLPKKITDPTISIPVALANNFGEATGLGMSSLFYLAFILFVLSFAVISFAKFYFLRKAHI